MYRSVDVWPKVLYVSLLRPSCASMAPKKRPAAWVATSNKRRRARETAVKTMNDLALGAGAATIPVKSRWRKVEKFIKNLQNRKLDDAATDSLRDAVQSWSDNGGHLQGVVVPAPIVQSGSCGDASDDVAFVPKHKVLLPVFKLESHAFMGTYNAGHFTEGTWPAFEKFTKSFAQKFGATAWGACLEETLHPTATQPSSRYHCHNYFYWEGGDGVRLSNTDALVFEQVRPRVDKCTVTAPSMFKTAAMHGLWYVSGIRKMGGIAESSNYVPWRNYYPKPDWLTALWGQHKLTHDQFEETSARFRVGHAERMQELAAVRRTERAVGIRRHLKKEASMVPASSMSTFKVYPEIEEFVSLFLPNVGLHRRPILVIIGGTNLGKSMLAAHVLTRIAAALGLKAFIEVTVEGDGSLDLSHFDVDTDAGVLLDGVGDALMLHGHRESLQGRAKEGRGGKSTTMMYAYPFTLCHRAVVVTMDLSASNLQYFTEHHWLSDKRNVIALRLEAQAWV